MFGLNNIGIIIAIFISTLIIMFIYKLYKYFIIDYNQYTEAEEIKPVLVKHSFMDYYLQRD